MFMMSTHRMFFQLVTAISLLSFFPSAVGAQLLVPPVIAKIPADAGDTSLSVETERAIDDAASTGEPSAPAPIAGHQTGNGASPTDDKASNGPSSSMSPATNPPQERSELHAKLPPAKLVLARLGGKEKLAAAVAPSGTAALGVLSQLKLGATDDQTPLAEASLTAKAALDSGDKLSAAKQLFDLIDKFPDSSEQAWAKQQFYHVIAGATLD